MKKLIGLGLLLLAGCQRQAVVSSPSPATGAVGGIGGATTTDALAAFMAGARAEDLQAVGAVWGDHEGLAREKVSRSEFEMRAYIMVKCLRHDRYTVLSEGNAAGGRRVMNVQITKGPITKSTNFKAVRGPQGRWFIEHFEIEPLNQICQLP